MLKACFPQFLFPNTTCLLIFNKYYKACRKARKNTVWRDLTYNTKQEANVNIFFKGKNILINVRRILIPTYIQVISLHGRERKKELSGENRGICSIPSTPVRQQACCSEFPFGCPRGKHKEMKRECGIFFSAVIFELKFFISVLIAVLFEKPGLWIVRL